MANISNMEYLDLSTSDHRPIRVCFSLERDNPMKGRFFFDKHMLSRDGFEDMVRLSWEGGEGDSSCTMDRIRQCRRKIMGCKRNSDMNSRDRITRLRAKLESEVAKMSPSFDTMNHLKQELSEA